MKARVVRFLAVPSKFTCLLGRQFTIFTFWKSPMSHDTTKYFTNSLKSRFSSSKDVSIARRLIPSSIHSSLMDQLDHYLLIGVRTLDVKSEALTKRPEEVTQTGIPYLWPHQDSIWLFQQFRSYTRLYIS